MFWNKGMTIALSMPISNHTPIINTPLIILTPLKTFCMERKKKPLFHFGRSTSVLEFYSYATFLQGSYGSSTTKCGRKELEDDGRRSACNPAERRCARGIRLLKPNPEQPIKFVWPALSAREHALKALRLWSPPGYRCLLRAFRNESHFYCRYDSYFHYYSSSYFCMNVWML